MTTDAVVEDVLYLTPDDEPAVAVIAATTTTTTENDHVERDEMIKGDSSVLDVNASNMESEKDNETETSATETNEISMDNTRPEVPKDEQQTQVTESCPNANSNKDDHKTKIRKIFKNACYFLIKSINYENVDLAMSKGVWSTPRVNETKLNRAFRECSNVILIFSVSESGRFQGYARLSSESKYDGQNVNWLLPPNLNPKSLSGIFKIDWISKSELQFNKTQHLLNSWNDNKPVKIGRDGQEIEPSCGESLCRLFPSDPDVDINPIITKCEEKSKVDNHSCINNNDLSHHYSKTKRHYVVHNDNDYESKGSSHRHHSHVVSHIQASSKHRHRSPSPRKRRRSHTPPLLNIPKEVVLNGTYQDYQSYLASSSIGSLQAQPTPYYAMPPVQQPHYPLVQTQYGLGGHLGYRPNPSPYVNQSQYGLFNGTTQPYNYQMNMHPHHSTHLGTSHQVPQKYASKYEQDVEEFLKRTSHTNHGSRKHKLSSSSSGNRKNHVNKSRSRSRSNSSYSSKGSRSDDRAKANRRR